VIDVGFTTLSKLKTAPVWAIAGSSSLGTKETRIHKIYISFTSTNAKSSIVWKIHSTP